MPGNSDIGRKGRLSAAAVALVAATSLILQYVLLLQSTAGNVGPAWGTLRFFSYFTILANLGVVAVTLSACRKGTGWLARPRMRAGIALYIGVTGTIYFLILRHLWQPQGLQWWADCGLHYVSPVSYLAWWLLAPRHGGLNLRDAVAWLLFPLLYLAWVLLRGAWLGEYPYPFIDAGQLGYAKTAVNALGVLLAFLLLGGILLALDRLMSRRESRAGTR